MIEHGSKLFALEAKKELDSIEGVPGTPGVRHARRAAVPAHRTNRPETSTASLSGSVFAGRTMTHRVA